MSKPDKISGFRLKVLGLGGAGGNAVAHLTRQELLPGAELVAINTDAQALAANPAPEKLAIGATLTHGLGAGGDAEIGARAAQLDSERIAAVVQGAKVVFLTAGLGGGTGGGAAPVVARIAREQNALALAFVALPFGFEGERRRQQAAAQLEQLKAQADAVICIPNDKLFKLVGEQATAVEAFRKCDEIIASGAQAIWQLLSRPGLINLDFADIRTVLSGKQGEGLFARGEAEGDDRAKKAVRALLESPLLDGGLTLGRADGVLISILGGPDLALTDVQKIVDAIKQEAPRAQIIMGAAIEETYRAKVAVTVLAAAAVAPRRAVPVATTPAARVATPEQPPAPKKRESAKPKQTTLELDPVTRGRFEKSEPTLWNGENLDVPTFLRRGVALNR
jgi:cell division protein FtsZ